MNTKPCAICKTQTFRKEYNLFICGDCGKFGKQGEDRIKKFVKYKSSVNKLFKKIIW